MAEKTKEQLLAELHAKMEKDFGKGTIIGAADKIEPTEVQSTGNV